MIKIDFELNAIEIGNRIKNKLSELNLKQTDLVQITGISKTAISNYVLGNRVPDTKSIYLISVALNATIEWLILGKNDNNKLTNEELFLLKKYNLLNERNKGKVDNFIDERIAEQECSYTKDHLA